MLFKRVFSVGLLATTLMFSGALAQEKSESSAANPEAAVEETKPRGRIARRAEERRKRLMAEYEATGEVDACVPMRSLRQSIIFDNQTIFFEATGRRAYINRLPHECPGLLREQRFAYSNSFGSLCRAQIITILDNFGRTWGSCGLGDFEELKKKPKDDAGDK